MAELLISDLPEELFARLEKQARAEHRSVSEIAVHLLTEILLPGNQREQHKQTMASILKRTSEKQTTNGSCLEMLREDRGR